MARGLGSPAPMRRRQVTTKAPSRCGGASIGSSIGLDTLNCTRGPNFPLSRLETRLMCPACESRGITVVFEPPTNLQVGGG